MFPNAMTAMWVAGIILQIVLAVVLVVRQVWRRFPVFFSYVLFNLLSSCVLYLVTLSHSMTRYAYAYWTAQCGDLAFALGVIFEVFSRLFTPYPVLRKRAMLYGFWTVLALVAFGLLVFFAQPPADRRLTTEFTKAEEAVRILQVGLVVFLCLFAGFFRLHWRQSEFGIALGMGVYAAIQLVAVTLYTYIGSRAWYSTSMLGMIAFDAGWLIWLGYMLLPQLDRPASP